MTIATGAVRSALVRLAKNSGAGQGIIFELGALPREQLFDTSIASRRVSNSPGPVFALHRVDDRRNLLNGLALAEHRLVQADSRSALEIEL